MDDFHPIEESSDTIAVQATPGQMMDFSVRVSDD